jgi:tetratricopeptide (TPR) repeat protein
MTFLQAQDDPVAAARQREAAGDFVAALQLLSGQLHREPGNRRVLAALAALSNRLGNPADALALCEMGLSSHADDWELRLERAGALDRLGRSQEAADCLAAVVRLRPQDPTPALRLSYLLRRQFAYAAAERVCAAMTDSHPGFAMGWVSRGIGDYTAGRIAEAETCFMTALALEPGRAEAHFALAANLLAQGRWHEGFAEFEWRRRLPDAAPEPAGLAAWDGGGPPGSRILLWNDQGFGDALQFLRYVPQIAARGYRPVLQLARDLVRLAASVEGVDAVAALDETPPPCHAHLPLMSAAAVLGTPDDAIPAETPYLSPDPAAVAAWRERLSAEAGLKIGLVWSGAPRQRNFHLNAVDRRRSIDLSSFAPLLRLDGVRFVSLQKGEAAAQIAALPRQWRPLDPMAEVTDFADTAAIVANLDLVISVDTSVAHLAGALARPVWILSRFDGCWRWRKTGADSPWYPTARIFRQPTPGDWDAVLREIAAALRRMAVQAP